MNKEEMYERIGENEEEIQRLEGEILHRCKRIADKEAVENDYGMLYILLGKRATYANDTRRLTVLIERQSIDDEITQCVESGNFAPIAELHARRVRLEGTR